MTARPPLMWQLIHLLAWQGGWFVAVFTAAHGRPWLAVTAALPTLIIHGVWFRREPLADLPALLLTVILGVLVDAALGVSGVLRMADGAGEWTTWGSPWMAALWLMLASGLRFSMSWLPGFGWPIQALLGAVGGVAAYLGGVRLGAIEVSLGITGWIAIAGAWAIALPALIRITGIFRLLLSVKALP